MKRHFFIITTIIFCFCNVWAQRTTYYDDHSGMSSSRVSAAVQDKRGLMWFATWNGLNAYDGYNFYWLKSKPGDGSSTKNDHVSNMMLSPDGNIWCYADNEVFEFDTNTYTYRSLPAATQNAARKQMGKYWHRMVDRQGNVWMSYGKGVYKATIDHHPAIPIKETKGLHARTLFLDRDDRLWICTMEDENVRIYEEDGTLLRTTHAGYKVYSMFQGNKGYIFVGCNPGGFRRVLPTISGGKTISIKEHLISGDEAYDIQRDQQGRLWIASFNGGVKCCPNPYAEKPTVSSSFGGYRMRRILITPRGNIIAGGSKGLLIGRIDSKDYRRTRLRKIERDGKNITSLSNEAIMDIAQDSHGNIYLATESSGISMISEEKLFGKEPEFTHFNEENSSLASDFCRSLTLLNDTTIMVVGSHNMMLFNPKSNITTNYNHTFWADTCHFTDGKPVVLHNGDIIFGTETGAYRVKAQSIYGRGYIPPLLVTEVFINGKNVDQAITLQDTITLAPNERNISIRFAALDLSDNRYILYRTSLDDTPWTHASRDREITLYDLKPGTYQLHIQSTDRYGRWVDNVKTVTITVLPRWYETWWARLIGILLAVAFMGAVMYTNLYIGKLKRQRREALEKYMAFIARTTESTASAIATTQRKHTDEMADTTMHDSDQQTAVSEELKPEDQWFLDKIRHYIERNISNSSANIDEMAAETATSRSTLNRRLNSIIGITAAQLLIDARMQHATRLLTKNIQDNTGLSIADIAFKCGYTDPKYFSRCFKQKYGVAPSDYVPEPQDMQ